MKTRTIIALAWAAAATAAGPLASAGVIDFEDLGVASGTQLTTAAGVSQNSGGFVVSPGPINTSGLNDLHFHNQNSIGNNGSTHLGTHDDVVFTLLGGGAFSILSFDFEGYGTEGGLSVVGSLSGGGTITQSITPDGDAATYQNFSLSGFNNLSSIAFNYLGSGSTGFFLDNIAFSRVPEPGTLALLGLGLAGLGLSRRRKAA